MDGFESTHFWDMAAADLYRYGSGVSFGTFIKHYFSTPGFRYTFWMRAAHFLRRRHIVFRPAYYWCRIVLHGCSVKYGIGIPYNTNIGPGLYIGHYGGIVVNDQAIIGRDCNINHGVTIGATYGGKRPGVPTIGDRAFLGPGCKVIGGIALGNDVAVGANAVVMDTVPDNGVAVGVPAKIVSLKGSYNYVVNTGYASDAP